MGKASALVSKLNLVASPLGKGYASAVETMNRDVNKVNDLLGQIATFNTAISRLEVGKPGSALEVRDELQGVYEELAQYVNFNVKPLDSSPGNIQVFIQDTSGNDIFLVNKGVVDNYSVRLSMTILPDICFMKINTLITLSFNKRGNLSLSAPGKTKS